MSETRYAQVARDLAEGSGPGAFRWVPCYRPSSSCAIRWSEPPHGASALKELQELGLVSRRKKAGTRVEAVTATSGYRQSLASVEDLVQFGTAHVRVVREIQDVVADRALARELGCAPGSRWLRISSLRLNGEPNAAPIGWTDVYVDAAYAELRDIVRECPDVLISSLIEFRFGRRIAEIRQEIQAVLLPAKLAEELGAEAWNSRPQDYPPVCRSRR